MENLRNALISQERGMITLRERMKANLRHRWRWLKSNGRTDEECIRNMIGMSTHIREFIVSDNFIASKHSTKSIKSVKTTYLSKMFFPMSCSIFENPLEKSHSIEKIKIVEDLKE